MASEDQSGYEEMELSVPQAVDERRHPRLRNPEIDGKVPQRIGVRMVDISVSGVGLESQVPLGSDVDYRLVLDNERRHIERDASLIWNRLERTSQSRHGESAPVYRSGLAFAPGVPGAARELMLFMREVGPEPKRNVPQIAEDTSLDRAATRYSLTRGFKLFLDAEPEFSIRSLSLSGVLLETRLRLLPEAQVTLYLQLPGSQVEAMARVVSLERASESRTARFRVALAFTRMSEAGRADLARYIDDRLDSDGDSSPASVLSGDSTPGSTAEHADPSPGVESQLEASAPRRAPAGWILPTLASLLGLGVLLTSVSAEAIREITSPGAWSGQHAVALSWLMKAVGAALVGVAGYLGLRWLFQGRAEP